MIRVLRAANGERRGEISFARATGDVRQKQIGGYAPPMADVWRKIFRPDKWMIGYAERFANILRIGSGRGSNRVTEYQARM